MVAAIFCLVMLEIQHYCIISDTILKTNCEVKGTDTNWDTYVQPPLTLCCATFSFQAAIFDLSPAE